MAESAQHYDYGLATISLYLQYFAKGWWQNPADHKKLTSLKASLDKKTLGRLLADLRTLARYEDDGSLGIDQSFEETLDARNFLMHEFFLRDPEELETQGGLVRKLTLLQDYQETINKAVSITSMVVEGLAKLRDDFKDPKRREATVNAGFENFLTARSKHLGSTKPN